MFTSIWVWHFVFSCLLWHFSSLMIDSFIIPLFPVLFRLISTVTYTGLEGQIRIQNNFSQFKSGLDNFQKVENLISRQRISTRNPQQFCGLSDGYLANFQWISNRFLDIRFPLIGFWRKPAPRDQNPNSYPDFHPSNIQVWWMLCSHYFF